MSELCYESYFLELTNYNALANTLFTYKTILTSNPRFFLQNKIIPMIKANLNSVVPSSEKIQKLLEDHSPLILLIDELIEYLIPARAIKIASSTLDSQILSFMKRLGEVVKSIDKVVLLTTSPSGTQYNQDDQLLLTLLDERLGRVEKVYTPVEDFEISRVVRKRLFSSIDNKQMEKIVLEVIEYYKTQNLIPSGYEPSEYKSKFLDSYPFLPDVIDCLYQRWGTFHSFQRTRGVLRILSLIIFNLKDSDISYITLSHFNLNNQEIRREFLRHIDSTYDGVIASDITDKGSGAKQIDKIVNPSYQGLHLGTYSSTTIFLYSFSGGQEKGVTLNEIKRSVYLPGIPSSVVSDAVDL